MWSDKNRFRSDLIQDRCPPHLPQDAPDLGGNTAVRAGMQYKQKARVFEGLASYLGSVWKGVWRALEDSNL